ncbi:MAG: TSUP family transporter [Myxococcaceae bacterium]|nr:TSUP family transporter [Myxococcaceae bacterium]MCA3014023.1 TSUP family transporter [Myxococcaceae bacterium]
MNVDLSLAAIAALTGVAFVAGLIDAIAGGGGLLTVPALLTAGLPPHFVFGTNKGAAVFGSGAAFWRFARARLIDGRRARWLFPAGFVGSCGGAALVLLVDPTLLRPLVLVLLVAAGVVVALVRPRPPDAQAPPVHRATEKAVLLALGLGAYDGFFGPGTGTFLIIGLVTLLRASLREASATAKVVNFASNLAAMLLFAARGLVLWKVSLPMALGQFLGGTVGAQLAVQGGDRLVRRVVLGVVLALVARLGYDLWA